MAAPEFKPIVNDDPVSRNASSRSKRSWVKTVAWMLGGLLFLLLTCSLVVTLCFEDKVLDVVLTQVYRSVDTEIRHEKASLSLWRKFPDVTVAVQDLSVAAKGTDAELARIGDLYLQFNLLHIIHGDYVLKKADIRNVSLNLHTYADSTHSWDILKPTEDTSSVDFSFQLSAVQCSKVLLRYWDEPADMHVRGNVRKLTAKGDFSRSEFALKCAAAMHVDTLRMNDSFCLENKEIRIDAKADVHLDSHQYVFRQCGLRVNRLQVSLDGRLYKCTETDWAYVVQAEGKQLAVKQLLAELPLSLQKTVSAYRPSGQLYVRAEARGCFGEETELHLKADAALSKAEIWMEEAHAAWKDVSMKAHFEASLPDMLQSAKIKVSNGRGTLLSSRVQLALQAENLLAPHVRGKLQASLRLEDMKTLFPDLSESRIGGEAVADLTVEHTFPKWSELRKESLRTASLKGSLQLENAFFQQEKDALLFEKISAVLAFSDQEVTVSRFSGEIQHNECTLSGRISPLLDYLCTDGGVLRLTANLSSPYVDVDAFLPTPEEGAASKTEEPFRFALPSGLVADVRVNAKRLKYDRFEASTVSGRLLLENNRLAVNDFSTHALGGEVKLQAELLPLKNGDFLLNAKGRTKDVDVQRLFYVMHDFGMENDSNGMTYKNIRGSASTEIVFSSRLDSGLAFRGESVNCDADLSVNNGKLLNYKPLEALSAFVKIEDLKEIRFETLKNSIGIHQEVITIPEMEIRSSAVNLFLSGKQSFQGDLHYNIKLHLNELLARKRRMKVSAEDFGEVEDDGARGMYLYLLVSGTTDNPVFKWNRVKAKEGMKESMQMQRREWQSLFTPGKGEVADSSSRRVLTPSQERKEERQRLNDTRQKPAELEIGDDW